MNRHERRAAKARAPGRVVDRVVAVHEAGHAVGRILCADSLGWGAEKAVAYIDMSAEHRDPEAEAATWGQFLSRPMVEFLQANKPPEAFDTPRDGTEMLALFAEMRAAGIDVDVWYRARSIETLFGPVAEAKLTGRSVVDVLSGEGCKRDWGDLVYFGFICGIAEERLDEAIRENIDITERYIARPEMWRAVLALADELKPGRMNGRVAAAIIARALTQ
jgi:hypothetical protein